MLGKWKSFFLNFVRHNIIWTELLEGEEDGADELNIFKSWFFKKNKGFFFPLFEDFCTFPLNVSADELWQHASSAIKAQELHSCNLAME